MAEILEVPDDLLDQLMTQFESNNNHDTSKNDDVDVVEMVYYETYVWETMIYTHDRTRRTACKPLKRILLPTTTKCNGEEPYKSNRSDRPFKLQQLEFDKVIHHVKLDEKYYLQ